MENNNIILALETIHKTAEKSELKLDVFASIPVEIKLVCDYFEVNTIEAILLATCFVKSCFNTVELPEIIKHFGLENHSFLIYLEHFNLLTFKSIVIKTEHRHSENDYKLSQHIYDYIHIFIKKKTYFLILMQLQSFDTSRTSSLISDCKTIKPTKQT